MGQETTLGTADIDCVLAVNRADGSREFYRVIDPTVNPDGTVTGRHVPITEAEYEEATR